MKDPRKVAKAHLGIQVRGLDRLLMTKIRVKATTDMTMAQVVQAVEDLLESRAMETGTMDTMEGETFEDYINWIQKEDVVVTAVHEAAIGRNQSSYTGDYLYVIYIVFSLLMYAIHYILAKKTRGML